MTLLIILLVLMQDFLIIGLKQQLVLQEWLVTQTDLVVWVQLL